MMQEKAWENFRQSPVRDKTSGSLPAENTESVLFPQNPAVVGLQPASAQYSESDLQAGYENKSMGIEPKQ